MVSSAQYHNVNCCFEKGNSRIALFFLFILASFPSIQSVEQQDDHKIEDAVGVEETAQEARDEDGDGAEGADTDHSQYDRENGQICLGHHFGQKRANLHTGVVNCYQISDVYSCFADMQRRTADFLSWV